MARKTAAQRAVAERVKRGWVTRRKALADKIMKDHGLSRDLPSAITDANEPQPNKAPSVDQITATAAAVRIEKRVADGMTMADALAEEFRRVRIDGRFDGSQASEKEHDRMMLQDFVGDLGAINNMPGTQHLPVMVSWSTAQALRRLIWDHVSNRPGAENHLAMSGNVEAKRES